MNSEWEEKSIWRHFESSAGRKKKWFVNFQSLLDYKRVSGAMKENENLKVAAIQLHRCQLSLNPEKK